MGKLLPLQIGDLKAKFPILQGGMGIGVSLGRLAGSVAKEGGIGIISAAQIGFMEEDFKKKPFEANLRAIHKEMKKAREIAKDGIIGFNIMVAASHYADYVKEAVKAGADLIVSGAGLPVDLPAYVKGAQVKLAPIVSTVKSASVLLKYWDKKHHRMPDLVIIEGPQAGGHLGFSREQVESFDQETYGEEIRNIIQLVKKYEQSYEMHIPVAIGGGIDTKEKADWAFSLGADAIQVASRFVTTEECDAAQAFKESYINARQEDIVITKSPVGMPGRAIKNSFLEKVERGENIPHGCYGCLERCNPAQTPYCITEALIHAAKGETEDALLFCGANAWKAEKIQTVAEVMDSLLK